MLKNEIKYVHVRPGEIRALVPSPRVKAQVLSRVNSAERELFSKIYLMYNSPAATTTRLHTHPWPAGRGSLRAFVPSGARGRAPRATTPRHRSVRATAPLRASAQTLAKSVPRPGSECAPRMDALRAWPNLAHSVSRACLQSVGCSSEGAGLGRVVLDAPEAQPAVLAAAERAQPVGGVAERADAAVAGRDRLEH